MTFPFQSIDQAFSSGTSTLATPNQSSSTQPPPSQAVTAAQIAVHHPSIDNGTSINGFFEKWGVPISGMIMTGVIGYFAAIFPLKDEINDNKTEISVAKKEIENIQEGLKRIEDEVNEIPKINTQIAVIHEKMTNTKKK